MRRRLWQLVALLVLAIPIVLILFQGSSRELERGAISLSPFVVELMAVTGLAIGGALIAFQWTVIFPFVILIHEIGHALAGALLGGRPMKIMMDRDGSGIATIRHSSPSRLLHACIGLVGEIAPGLAALGGAIALRTDNAYGWLFLNSLLLFVILIGLARSPTVISVILFVLVGIALYLWLWPWMAPLTAGFFMGIWGFGGCRSTFGQMKGMRKMRLMAADPILYDAEKVQLITGVSALVVAKTQHYAALFLAICMTCLVVLRW